MIPQPSDVVIEDVIGYKGFRIRQTDNGPRLQSPLFPVTFEPGEWMVAECRGHHGLLPPDHPDYHGPLATDRAQWSPVKDCGGHGCGFYAGRTWNHLVDMGYARYSADDPRIICKIQMQGKIIPATNGFRAQQVRPLVMYVPHELWRLGAELKNVYGPHGVELEMAATLVAAKAGTAEAVVWCAKCTAKLKRSTTCHVCSHRNI